MTRNASSEPSCKNFDLESNYNLDSNSSVCPRALTKTSNTSGSEDQRSFIHSQNDFILSLDEQEIHCDVESLSSSSDSEEEDVSVNDLTSRLATWASEFNISFVAIASLLSVLRPFHPSLPKDPRTLLKTPRICTNEIKSIAGGSYFHFGIVDSVSKLLQKCSICLDGIKQVFLQINIDGLPLFKSSNTQFGPILGRIS